MLIYGTRTTTLRSETVFAKCEHCQNQNAVTLSILQQYAHIYWIPFFPIRKTAVSQCSHCKQVLEQKDFSPALMDEALSAKSQLRTPIWTFALSILLGIGITMAVISNRERGENLSKRVSEPRVGDIFSVKSDGTYGLIKVSQVTQDSVFIFESQMRVNRSKGLSQLRKLGDAAFAAEPTAYAKTKLKEMSEKGEIQGIEY